MTGPAYDRNWGRKALCRTQDPELFFVLGKAQNEVKTKCYPCPVRVECLGEALDSQIEFGVWGGTTERERRAILQRQKKVVSWTAELVMARDAELTAQAAIQAAESVEKTDAQLSAESKARKLKAMQAAALRDATKRAQLRRDHEARKAAANAPAQKPAPTANPFPAPAPIPGEPANPEPAPDHEPDPEPAPRPKALPVRPPNAQTPANRAKPAPPLTGIAEEMLEHLAGQGGHIDTTHDELRAALALSRTGLRAALEVLEAHPELVHLRHDGSANRVIMVKASPRR